LRETKKKLVKIRAIRGKEEKKKLVKIRAIRGKEGLPLVK